MTDKSMTTEVDKRRLCAAIEIAYEAHEGQKRGGPGNEDYINHPLRVMLGVRHRLPGDVDAMIAAVLHDVVEDSPTTLDEIGKKFGSVVRAAVDAVSRRKEAGESYDDFITRISVGPPLGIVVKIADITDNLREPFPRSDSLKRRYEKARARLEMTQATEPTVDT